MSVGCYCCCAEDCSAISPAFRIAAATSGRLPWTAFKWSIMPWVGEKLKANIHPQLLHRALSCVCYLLPRRTPTSLFHYFSSSSSVQIPPNHWLLMSTLPRTLRRKRAMESAVVTVYLRYLGIPSVYNTAHSNSKSASTWMERHSGSRLSGFDCSSGNVGIMKALRAQWIVTQHVELPSSRTRYSTRLLDFVTVLNIS